MVNKIIELSKKLSSMDISTIEDKTLFLLLRYIVDPTEDVAKELKECSKTSNMFTELPSYISFVHITDSLRIGDSSIWIYYDKRDIDSLIIGRHTLFQEIVVMSHVKHTPYLMVCDISLLTTKLYISRIEYLLCDILTLDKKQLGLIFSLIKERIKHKEYYLVAHIGE